MNALIVDPSTLIDEFDYYEYIEKDAYSQAIYKDPVRIEKVRIDRSTVFSRNGKETKMVANAIIFCYASATTPFPRFKEESKVVFDGKEHIIKKVVPCMEPYRNILWSIELEVI